MSNENKLKERDLKIKQWAFDHPFIIIISLIAIAHFGYRFGIWLHSALN